MIDSEQVDFQAIASQLQTENEQLRLYILKLRNAKFSPVAALMTGSIKKFLISNYLVIASIGTLLFIVLALTDTVKGLFRD